MAWCLKATNPILKRENDLYKHLQNKGKSEENFDDNLRNKSLNHNEIPLQILPNS